jgi:hypothetical protein
MGRRAALIRSTGRKRLGKASPLLTRLALLGSALFFLASAFAKEKEPKKKPGHAIHLRSIDLARRYVLIELSGVSRPPAPNLFTFTDERDRHFVAMNISCDPPFPSGIRACELAIPDGYERHKLVKLELHLGGLHSRSIEVPSGEIASAWEAAMATKVEPPKMMMPSPSPTPSPKPKTVAKPSPRPSPRPSPSPAPKKK